jgi:two-component system phosphate regulon sensor histidine kinase PhoR
LPGPDGRERWYSITASPLAREPACAGDTSGGSVVVLRDISHQKGVQQRNAEFVSAVSHEMKAPLAGIKAYVEMLADGEAEDAQTQEEFLGVINTQADRLRRLIDNMLNLARIESGVVAVRKAACSLNDLLVESLNVIRPSAESKKIELAADLSPMYLNANVDRDQMLQAAINLLSNAVKYTHPGGKVTLRSRMTERHVQFDVEDTGVGLCPEDCQKVFEKFYRVQKDSQMAHGTGLGLPLAKYIVEDVHGGRLSLASQLGVGSTFTVVLPAVGKEE